MLPETDPATPYFARPTTEPACPATGGALPPEVEEQLDLKRAGLSRRGLDPSGAELQGGLWLALAAGAPDWGWG